MSVVRGVVILRRIRGAGVRILRDVDVRILDRLVILSPIRSVGTAGDVRFVNGVFDLTGIVYYLTVIVLFLFLSVQSLEKRRYN